MRIKLLVVLSIAFILSAFTLTVNDFVETLTQKLERYKQQSPQVKLFLFFNQQVYMPGDTAFFSIRFLTEDMIPVAGRQIIRIALKDVKGNVMFFQNVGVKDGTGSNQVAIPADLKEGVYRWIAYSDWMKNFHPQLFFGQDFLIVERDRLVPNKSVDPTINFSPEGGNLISSVSNRVVVSGAQGISTLRILDSSREQVAQCDVSREGIGQFSITPLPGQQYFAEAQYQGKILRTQLPSSNDEGISIQLFTESIPAKLELRSPRDSKLRSENLWMVVSARSEVYFTVPIKFDSKELFTVQFKQNELPSGICYATIFNERGEVLAERLFALNNQQQIMVNTRKEKSVVGTREGVNLEVSIKNESGQPVAGEYAVSIVNKKFANELLKPASITNYLRVDSDLSSSATSYSFEVLDLFLITQKNVRVKWKNVWNEQFSNPYSFKRLIQYSGNLVNRTNSQSVPDSSRVITYLQKNMMGYEAAINKDGSFDLAFLFDFWNEDEIYYVVENKRGKELNSWVQWQVDSISTSKSEIILAATEMPDNYATFQMRNQLVNRSYNFYKTSSETVKASDAMDPNRDFEDELSGADFTVKVDDYVIFPTMEELIREVIPSVQHRKVKGKSQVKVVMPDGALPSAGPLYMIDGIMTRDTDYFLQLNPGDVITVKVVRAYNKLISMGSLAKNGIVLVYTKGVDHKALKATNTMLKVKGLNRPVPFKVVNHSGSDSHRIPDFRSTLYWNPSVKVDANGSSQISFSASDAVGTFLIYIQGLTADGVPFEKLDSLKIQFNKN